MSVLVDTHIHLTDEEFVGLLQPIMNMLRTLNIKAVSVSMDIVTSTKNMGYVSKK